MKSICRTKKYLKRTKNTLPQRHMTHNLSEDAIKIIYGDEFFSKPQNRHHRDELIKKLVLHENELLEHKKMLEMDREKN